MHSLNPSVSASGNNVITEKILLWIYALVSLVFSFVIFCFSVARGLHPAAFTVFFYLAVLLVILKYFDRAIVFLAVLVFVAGWMTTTYPGININVSAGMMSFGASIFALKKVISNSAIKLDKTKILLLSFSGFTLISSVYSLTRILGFHVAPGFPFMPYPVGPTGVSSSGAILIIIANAGNIFSWFGLLLAAEKFPFEKAKLFAVTLLALIAVNAGVVLVQEYYPSLGLLHPYGYLENHRLNGLTSFCYALGAATEPLILLFPMFFIQKAFRMLSLPYMALTFYAMHASGSRTALFTQALAILFWGLAWFAKRFATFNRNQRTVAIAVAIALLVSSITIFSVIEPDNVSSLGRLKRDVVGKEGILNYFHRTRGHHYQINYDMISHFPMTGIGFSSYIYEAKKYIATNLPDFKITDPYGIASHSTNTFLGIATEQGLFALVLFGAFLISLLLSKARNEYSFINLLLRLGVIAYSLGLMLGPQLLNPEASVFFILFVGAIHWTHGQDNTMALKKQHVKIFVIVLLIILSTYSALYFFSASKMDLYTQWKNIGWNMRLGFNAEEKDGFWTKEYASLNLTGGKLAKITWSVAAKEEGVAVDFWLNQKFVESRSALPDNTNISIIRLSDDHPNNLFAIHCHNPVIPAEAGESNDRRILGIFIHSIEYIDSLGDIIGAYPEELDDLGGFHWVPETCYLPYPLAEDSLTLAVRPFKIPSEEPFILSLYIDNELYQTFELSSGWSNIDIARDKFGSQEMQKGDHRIIMLKGNYAVSPATIDSESEDTRILSFALRIFNRTTFPLFK